MTGWKPIPLQSSHDLDSNRYSQGNDEPRKEKGGEHDGKEEAQKTLVRFPVAGATIFHGLCFHSQDATKKRFIGYQLRDE